MTTRLRAIVGGAALATGLWFLSGAVAAPALPAGTLKKAAEADVAQLQKHLETCLSDAKEARRFGPTAKALALMIAMYAEAAGDTALKDGALKAADQIAAKDYKAASDTVKGLKVTAAGKALPASGIHSKAGFSLDEAMSPFRTSRVGGLNLEKDIRDYMNAKMPMDTAAVELLAARTAVLGEFSLSMPNDKADINKANKDKWARWSVEMSEISGKISAEAGKGKSANEKELIKLLKALDAKCLDCHNEFRD